MRILDECANIIRCILNVSSRTIHFAVDNIEFSVLFLLSVHYEGINHQPEVVFFVCIVGTIDDAEWSWAPFLPSIRDGGLTFGAEHENRRRRRTLLSETRRKKPPCRISNSYGLFGYWILGRSKIFVIVSARVQLVSVVNRRRFVPTYSYRFSCKIVRTYTYVFATRCTRLRAWIVSHAKLWRLGNNKLMYVGNLWLYPELYYSRGWRKSKKIDDEEFSLWSTANGIRRLYNLGDRVLLPVVAAEQVPTRVS